MPKPSHRFLVPGQLLAARYRITGIIGRDARGIVYAARDQGSDLDVAVRVLAARNVRDQPGFGPLFVEECKRRLALSHPHAFEVLGFGQTRARRLFIVSALWRGIPLSRALTARGPLDAHLTCEIVSRLCGALAQAHALGLVHGRVSPKMVYLTGRGVGGIKLAGFDEAVLSGTAAPRPIVRGEACFSAPERAAGAALTPRTDIYGVGLLLFALLTGRAPHEHESALNILMRQQREGAFPRAFRRTLLVSAPLLLPIIERCLAINPVDRFTSIACVRDALQRPQVFVAA